MLVYYRFIVTCIGGWIIKLHGRISGVVLICLGVLAAELIYLQTVRGDGMVQAWSALDGHVLSSIALGEPVSVKCKCSHNLGSWHIVCRESEIKHFPYYLNYYLIWFMTWIFIYSLCHVIYFSTFRTDWIAVILMTTSFPHLLHLVLIYPAVLPCALACWWDWCSLQRISEGLCSVLTISCWC